MNSAFRILYECDQYRLYSIYENVYLKNIHRSESDNDIIVASVYGDPDSGLISFGNDYVAIAGCGITIHFLNGDEGYEIGTEADNVFWTEGIYQSGEDDFKYVRFTAYTDV
ncbi:hypothetical protein Q4519_20390 [Motilimonas sp. 1_MG-2023]|uniref:hypothetical protein n=1 Tax=Motilimonas sp. 1_MG-2023 TaxID=3062672 RepID=UPI0026E28B7F|nr:hypothetical protein [Motilimonas sp. 1_MG-2023]MDO6528038.1 hypothetical protein [Motilimonas sp. 1_MG-2023]